MKKKLLALIALLLVLATCTCQAANNYTLPEKMHNQLAIGSGLKGKFRITTTGEKFKTPFLNAISDADFSLRGISSGKDLHYYVFQSDETEQQSAMTELYRREGLYYFKSDMVPGKILEFPTATQVLEELFPAKGKNAKATTFAGKILSLTEDERKDNWDPVFAKYQNQLEIWLADFADKPDIIKMESGTSAVEFNYVIPMDQVKDKIISLYGSILSDKKATALLQSVMSKKERNTYLNKNLLYFYREALDSLTLNEPLHINKRVSALGDLISFRMELPLDERTTGWKSLDIQLLKQLTVYTLKKTGNVTVLAVPSAEALQAVSYEQSIWYANVKTDATKEELEKNRSVRIDIKKTNKLYDKDDKNHETDHYTVKVTQDTTYLPADVDAGLLPEYEPIDMEIDLHYSSKYPQNSATTLEITADVRSADSTMNITAKLQTAAPWLFIPFEVKDPVQVGANKEKVLDPYLTEWISNAASIIRHTVNENEAAEESAADPNAEAQPLEEADPS